MEFLLIVGLFIVTGIIWAFALYYIYFHKAS